MLKKLLSIPVKAATWAAAKAMGRGTAPDADAPPPPPPRRASPPKPASAAAPAPADGHDHSHGHDHGHDHDHAAKAAVDVQVEDTPNPNAKKFTCSIQVLPQGTVSFANATEAQKHPIGRAVFAVGGVRNVFATNNFVTVTKLDDADWGTLTPRLLKAIKASVG